MNKQTINTATVNTVKTVKTSGQYAGEKLLVATTMTARIISKIADKAQQISFDKAVTLRSQRKGISQEEAAQHIHNQVVNNIDGMYAKLKARAVKSKDQVSTSAPVTATFWEPKIA